MLKKTFPLLLFSILLIGCTPEIKDKEPVTPPNVSNSVSLSLSKTYSIKDILINDEVGYSSKYSFSENLIVFPDSANNNKLSISNLDEFDSFITKDSITKFYDYSISNTITIDNSIYFTSNSANNRGIYKLDYEKNTIDKISNYIPINLIHQNDFLYFTNLEDKYIYSLDLKTNKVDLLSNNKVGKFLVSNDFIIYQNLNDYSKLYAFKTDKTHNVKLTDTSVESFVALNNEILFFDASNNNILSSLNLATEMIETYNNIVGYNLKSDSINIYFISFENPNKLYSLNREDLTSQLIEDEFLNDYYPIDNKIFLEMAISLDKVYILDMENIEK